MNESILIYVCLFIKRRKYIWGGGGYPVTYLIDLIHRDGFFS